jgi:parallel beta-helix repeat protein
MVAAAGASTVPTTTPVTDDNIAGGAAIYIRTVGWIVESATVSATGGITAGNTVLNMAPGSFQGVGQTALAYQPGTKPGGVNAAGYYLVNKLWMLSAAPGWYHDGTTLYVHLPDGTAPSSTSVGRVVEVSTTPRNYGIQLTNQPYVNISGIRVKQFGMDGIIVSSTESNSTLNQHTFNDMQVLNSGQNGITFANGAASPNGPTGTVSNSYINESVIDGVNLYYTNNVNVINNRIENSGVTGGPFRSRGAIWGMQSNNMVATGNSISRSGYIGIRFQGNATVKNNIIKDSCLVLDDCGGIYGWNNLNSIPLNSVISNNIIENVYGNRYGDPDSFTGATGIYLDDTASYVQVRGNTIINAGQGLYTHNGWKNVFDSNVIAYPRVVAMVSAFDYITLQSFYQQGNIFSNNTVLSGNHPNLQMYFHLGRLPSENITSGFPFPVQIMTANKYSGNSANTLMFVRSMVGTSGFSGTGSGSTGPETFATLVGKANHGTYRVMRKAAGLIVNKTAASVSYNCVASSSGITMWELKTTDCLNAKNFNGTKIKYPVTIPPYSSLPVFQ